MDGTKASAGCAIDPLAGADMITFYTSAVNNDCEKVTQVCLYAH